MDLLPMVSNDMTLLVVSNLTNGRLSLLVGSKEEEEREER